MPYLNDFLEFLASLSTERGLALGLLGFLIFLLAYTIGWLVGRRKVVRTRKQLELATRERQQYQDRLQTNEEEEKKLARQLVSLTTEKDELLVQLRQERNTTAELRTQLTPLRAEREELRATNQSYATTIEDLNDQIIGLKTRNEQLLDQPEGGAAGGNSLTLTARLTRLEERLSRLETTN